MVNLTISILSCSLRIAFPPVKIEEALVYSAIIVIFFISILSCSTSSISGDSNSSCSEALIKLILSVFIS